MGKRGKTFKLGTPYPSSRKDKRFMVIVRNPKTKRLKTIHFGQKGLRPDHSEEARKKYLARSGGIRDKKGRLTKNNKLSANYWARRILWGAR